MSKLAGVFFGGRGEAILKTAVLKCIFGRSNLKSHVLKCIFWGSNYFEFLIHGRWLVWLLLYAFMIADKCGFCKNLFLFVCTNFYLLLICKNLFSSLRTCMNVKTSKVLIFFCGVNNLNQIMNTDIYHHSNIMNTICHNSITAKNF